MLYVMITGGLLSPVIEIFFERRRYERTMRRFREQDTISKTSLMGMYETSDILRARLFKRK